MLYFYFKYIIVGNGIGHSSSNPVRDSFCRRANAPMKGMSPSFLHQQYVDDRADWVIQLKIIYLTNRKFRIQTILSLLKNFNYSARSERVIYIIIIIIIIISHTQRISPWLSLTTRLNRPSFPIGLQGYILYRQRAIVYRF